MKIIEVLNPAERNEEILSSEENLMHILEQNCSEALQALKEGRTVYKGIRTNLGGFVLTNPKLNERKSAATTNYYNLLMSNLPNWKDYPKRNRSLICSNALSGASYYGKNIYLVLPKNNATFGICPDYDIQECSLNKSNISLCHFNNILKRFDINQFSYKELIIGIFHNKNIFIGNDSEQILYNKFFSCESEKDIIGVLRYLLDPIALGFKVGNIYDVPLCHNDKYKSATNEIWTDSESYLLNINSNLYKKLVKNEN